MSTEEYYQLTAMFWDQVKETPKAKRKTIPLEINEPESAWQKGVGVRPSRRCGRFISVLQRKEDSHWRTGNTELAALGAWLTDAEHGAGELLGA